MPHPSSKWCHWRQIIGSVGSVVHAVVYIGINEFVYLSTAHLKLYTLTLVGNKIVDHSNVVGSSSVGAAPTASSFSTWLQWIGQRKLQEETRNIQMRFGIWCSFFKGLTVCYLKSLRKLKLLYNCCYSEDVLPNSDVVNHPYLMGARCRSPVNHNSRRVCIITSRVGCRGTHAFVYRWHTIDWWELYITSVKRNRKIRLVGVIPNIEANDERCVEKTFIYDC